MSVTTEELLIKISADTSGANSGLDSIKKMMGGVNAEQQKAKTISETLAGQFKSLEKIQLSNLVSGVRDATNMASSLVRNMIAIGKAMDDFADAATPFNRLGLDINAISNASGGLVSKLDLMQSANRLATAGFAMSTAQMEDMIQSAGRLGQAVGIDAADAIKTVSDSMITGNDRALKSLGITVNLTLAYEKWAAANNTTAAAMDESQKRLVAAAKILERLKSAAQDLPEVSRKGFDAFDSISNSISDGFLLAGTSFNNFADHHERVVNSLKDRSKESAIAAGAAWFLELKSTNHIADAWARATQQKIKYIDRTPERQQREAQQAFVDYAEKEIEARNKKILALGGVIETDTGYEFPEQTIPDAKRKRGSVASAASQRQAIIDAMRPVQYRIGQNAMTGLQSSTQDEMSRMEAMSSAQRAAGERQAAAADLIIEKNREQAESYNALNEAMGFNGEIDDASIVRKRGIADAYIATRGAIEAQIKTSILEGSISTKVLRQVLADQLSTIAARNAVMALEQIALGIAATVFSPATAAVHFAAAKAHGAVAIAAGAAGAAAASSSGGSRSGVVGVSSIGGSGFRDVSGGSSESGNVNRTLTVNVFTNSVYTDKRQLGAMMTDAINAAAASGNRISSSAVDGSGSDGGMSGV